MSAGGSTMNVISTKSKEHKVNTITEMCKLFQVSARTLRFYESKELLFPIRKGQHRLFTKSDRGRMKLIMQGKRFGFSLEEIRQLLNLYNFGDHRTRQIKQTYQLGLKRLSSMEQQKKELGMAIKDLKSQLELCKDLLLKRGADSRDL
jgi:DNA-binding transcriptional MerR regulator